MLGAFFLSRLLESFLYGVAPFDIPTLLGSAALLIAASLVATAVPARRAARVDPLFLLKQE
jgi:ABC-type antimicrobial peptide transport system permease subunit